MHISKTKIFIYIYFYFMELDKNFRKKTNFLFLIKLIEDIYLYI